MIDPKKLMALVARENGEKPLRSNPDDDEGEIEPMRAEGNPNDDDDDDDDDEEDLSEDEIEDILDMVEEGEGDPELMELAAELQEDIDEFGEEEAEQPPKWAADKSIWTRAKKAAQRKPKRGGASSFERASEPYAVVTHIYKKMKGRIG